MKTSKLTKAESGMFATCLVITASLISVCYGWKVEVSSVSSDWVNLITVMFLICSLVFAFIMSIDIVIERRKKEYLSSFSGSLEQMLKTIFQPGGNRFVLSEEDKERIIYLLRSLCDANIRPLNTHYGDGLVSTLLTLNIEDRWLEEIWFDSHAKPRDAEAILLKYPEMLNKKDKKNKTLLVLSIKNEGWFTVEFLLRREGIDMEGVSEAITSINALPTYIFFLINQVAPPKIKEEFAQPSYPEPEDDCPTR